MTTPNNILIYRDNETWTELAADLRYLASGQGTQVPEIKIFDKTATESDVREWLVANATTVTDAPYVCADGTCSRIILELELKCIFKIINLDDFLGAAADEVFAEVSPVEIYRQILARLVSTLGIKQVQIVLDAVVDYNPLALPEFSDWDNTRENLATLERCAEEFAKLVPEGVETKNLRISELEVPSDDTVVLVHHHALNQLSRYGKDGRDFTSCPRVLMPYPKGFVKRTGALCDIDDIVHGDLLETMRRFIRNKKIG